MYGLTELFYCETYNDADQIVKPHLSPRGKRTSGPYRSYEDAVLFGGRQQCSHFTVSKSFTKRDVNQIPWVTVGE
jgi:hypothetical protein